MAQRLDVAKGALTGEQVTLADGVAVDSRSWIAVSVAATGLVAYRTGGSNQRQLTWMDRSGTVRGTIGDPDGSLSNPRVSPDGRRVVVQRTVQGNQDIWLLDGARTSRFTSIRRLSRVPCGRRTAQDRVHVESDGGGDLIRSYERRGSGRANCDLSPVKNAYSWSADGRFLLYNSTDSQTNTDLWVVPMAGDHTPSLFLKTPFREVTGVFSPTAGGCLRSNERAPGDLRAAVCSASVRLRRTKRGRGWGPVAGVDDGRCFSVGVLMARNCITSTPRAP